jgi:saccharopine dehydrogenase-like NADP-dependent oxidoreductase
MKVLLLGGTGNFRVNAAALLARESLITKIGFTSRYLENAQKSAYELGSKGCAVCVDIQYVPELSTVASDYDIMINAAGPSSNVQIPTIQSAIEAGIHTDRRCVMAAN